jgi:hypothetical protein
MDKKEEKKPQSCDTPFINQPIIWPVNNDQITDYVPEWYIKGAYDTEVVVAAIAV